MVSSPDKLLPDVVDACLGVFGVFWLQAWLAIEVDFQKSIVFPSERFLLPLLQYPIGIETAFDNILKGLESICSGNLYARGHGPVVLRRWTVEEGYRRESRGGVAGDEGNRASRVWHESERAADERAATKRSARESTLGW